MGKKKSALLLTLFTLLIALLCFVCTVSFPYGNHYYNSVFSMMSKDGMLGASTIGGGAYNGGGYSAVLYPEGVISASEYEDDLSGFADEAERQEYAEGYVAYAGGALYLDKEKVCDGGDAPSEEFIASFEKSVDVMQARYELLREDGVRFEVQDDYTIRIYMPRLGSVNGSVQAVTFQMLAYTGELSVSYGSDEASASVIMPARANETVGEYVKNFYYRTGADGTAYVAVEFTKEGRSALASASADASGSTYLYIKAGETSIISLTVSEQIDLGTLYVSGSYTAESAKIVTILLDSVLAEGAEDDLTFTVGEMYESQADFGTDVMTVLYIVFGVWFVGMMIFFFARYHLLGFAHLFTYLLFLFANILCVWAIPFVYLGINSILAFALASVLLCVSNAVSFEYARREYAHGKTMTSSVKTGYKKCFWHLFDVHIVLALFAFVTFFIALTELSVFAFVLGLATVFSGVCSLAINRLMWAIMMPFHKNQGAFCNFRREETEDD